MYGYELSGRNFTARNTSLLQLISYAYEVQAKQVVGGPDWIDKDRYDITATVDENGETTHQQLRSMMKNLLASHFHFVFHADKQELPCYFLTVSASGPKLSPREDGGTLPGISMTPEPDGLAVTARNATMEDFAIYLQLILLDRPVVDDTRLAGRFNFDLRYMPEGSEYGGHPPALPPAARGAVPTPTLFAALRQQVGLELKAEDAFIDVIAIDRADKP